MHRLKISIALTALFSLGFAAFITPPAHSVGTLAGTEISCWSSATYTDEQGHLIGQASSNVLVMTVAKMRDVVVTPPTKDSDATVGQAAVVAAEIKNNSNSSESYSVSAAHSAGWVSKVYLDANGDGILQAGETTEVTTTALLAPDSTLRILVKVSVPADAQTGVKLPVVLRVTALGDGPPAQDSATYNLQTIANLPQLSIVSTPTAPAFGAPYTLTVRAIPAQAIQVNVRSLAPDGIRKVTTVTTDASGQAIVNATADCSGIWTHSVQYASVSDSVPAAAQAAMNCVPMTYVTVGSDMVSLPLQLTNPATGDLFDSALGVSVSKWMPSEARWASFSAFKNLTTDSGLQTLAAGQAYSTFSATTTTIAPEGRLINQTTPFAIDLQKGWNQIGSPFLTPVAWSACQVFYNGQTYSLTQAKDSGLMTDYAWTVAKNVSLFDYSIVHSQLAGAKPKLEPWKGYWVYAWTPVRLVINPSVVAASLPALGLNEWVIKVAAMGPTAQDTSNYFGVCANKSVQGLVNPPKSAAGDYEDLYFPTSAGVSGKYAVDIRTSITGVSTWTFEVLGSDAKQLHNLTWYNATSMPSTYTMSLKDLQNNRVTNMRSTTRYVYKPSAANKISRFQITVNPAGIR